MKYSPIIIGCNYENSLKASINDALLMYNLFYDFHKNNGWDEPILITDKYKKISLQIIKDSLNKATGDIIFYFSGHGKKNGYIAISDNMLNCEIIVNMLNKGRHIIFILDCCHSSSFCHIGCSFIYSSLYDEYAHECLTKIKLEYQYPILLMDKQNNKYPISVFTYFYFLTLKKTKMIFNKNCIIWTEIKNKFNQTYFEII
jgi:hypothetical protein